MIMAAGWACFVLGGLLIIDAGIPGLQSFLTAVVGLAFLPVQLSPVYLLAISFLVV